MTFEQVRQRHLEVLDLEFQRLREIVADPMWCNLAYKKYAEQFQAMESCLHKIARLNSTELEAS